MIWSSIEDMEKGIYDDVEEICEAVHYRLSRKGPSINDVSNFSRYRFRPFSFATFLQLCIIGFFNPVLPRHCHAIYYHSKEKFSSLGFIQQLRWQNFPQYWPPTLLTQMLYFLQNYLHMFNILTLSCQRTLWLILTPLYEMMASFMDDPKSPSQNNRGRIPWIRAANTLQFSNQKVNLAIYLDVKRCADICFYFYSWNRYISM